MAHALNAEAPLLGKLRDETGDILTPSHTKKGNRRHRYYVSNRLVSGKPDPAGWRLQAKAFEAAVACAIQDSLTRAAERHEVIVAKDVVVLQDASARAHSLAARH